jgi:nicotinamide riboside kinase
MKKICFVGAPSTGKSTIAKVLAKKLKNDGYTVEIAREYARDFIFENKEVRDANDQLFIAKGQKQREEEAAMKNPDFVVCDCAVFLSYVYASLHEPAKRDSTKDLKYKQVLKEIEKEIGSAFWGYDFVFFLPPEIPIENDGVRLYTDKILEISEKIKNLMAEKKIDYFEVGGDVNERLMKIVEKLRVKK